MLRKITLKREKSFMVRQQIEKRSKSLKEKNEKKKNQTREKELITCSAGKDGNN